MKCFLAHFALEYFESKRTCLHWNIVHLLCGSALMLLNNSCIWELLLHFGRNILPLACFSCGCLLKQLVKCSCCTGCYEKVWSFIEWPLSWMVFTWLLRQGIWWNALVAQVALEWSVKLLPQFRHQNGLVQKDSTSTVAFSIQTDVGMGMWAWTTTISFLLQLSFQNKLGLHIFILDFINLWAYASCKHKTLLKWTMQIDLCCKLPPLILKQLGRRYACKQVCLETHMLAIAIPWNMCLAIVWLAFGCFGNKCIPYPCCRLVLASSAAHLAFLRREEGFCSRSLRSSLLSAFFAPSSQPRLSLFL